MKTFLRFIIAFLALSGAAAIATSYFGVQFGRDDYWDHHGYLFLVFITFFPRLTLLLSGVAWGGLLWWLGLIFAPRVLVAILATLAYWRENPFLVSAAWLVALGGESSEKYVVVKRRSTKKPRPGRGSGFESAKWVDSD